MVADHDSTDGNRTVATISGARMDGPIRREVTIAAPAGAIWAALTDERELEGWFGAFAEIDLRRGGAVRFRWPDGSERRGLVVTLDPPRRLAFRWRDATNGRVTGTDASVVAFELVPAGDATHVVVTESPGIADTRPDETTLAEVRP